MSAAKTRDWWRSEPSRAGFSAGAAITARIALLLSTVDVAATASGAVATRKGEASVTWGP